MQIFNLLRLTILALLATLAGCVTTPTSAPEGRLFASDAVTRELRETRPDFTALAPDEQSVVHLWLLANCAVDANDSRMQLGKLGTHVEAALIEAFRMGPPTAFLSEIEDTRRRDYTAIKERLDGEDRELFGPELRARLGALSEDAYVNEGLRSTIVNYRLAALDGLTLVGGRAAVAWLERTAPTLKDPELSDVAARTLTTLHDRLRRY